ncbi:MAG: MurR/RpiR family transcriptional regulator [Ilumatobacteraceae bacterium]
MLVAERIAGAGETLTPAERRVAEVVLEAAQLVAFGTVADLAAAATAGAATVVRLAAKLGFDGFTGLQRAVQLELAGQLRPAAERIREPVGDDLVGRHAHVEAANVAATLGAVTAETLDEAVERLAAAGAVAVLTGDASTGVAQQIAADLGALRPAVELLSGNEVAVQRAVALLGPHDAVLAIDLRRYDRWVVDAARRLRDRGAWMLAITDSGLSPLAGAAQRSITVSAAGAGPFDSHVGTLALGNLLVAGVAERLRGSAVERIDRVEAAWREAGALTDR